MRVRESSFSPRMKGMKNTDMRERDPSLSLGMTGMKNTDMRERDPSLSLGMTRRWRRDKGSDGGSPREPPSLI
jgi:hypothetical protein